LDTSDYRRRQPRNVDDDDARVLARFTGAEPPSVVRARPRGELLLANREGDIADRMLNRFLLG
jgi:hypothetical protein